MYVCMCACVCLDQVNGKIEREREREREKERKKFNLIFRDGGGDDNDDGKRAFTMIPHIVNSAVTNCLI